jgi:hypothetical protein
VTVENGEGRRGAPLAVRLAKALGLPSARRRRSLGDRQLGASNLYSPENAWTDPSGALHVQIKKKSGRWSCAEIFLNRSLGYVTAHSCELNA